VYAGDQTVPPGIGYTAGLGKWLNRIVAIMDGVYSAFDSFDVGLLPTEKHAAATAARRCRVRRRSRGMA
jgi:hypothetical protein